MTMTSKGIFGPPRLPIQDAADVQDRPRGAQSTGEALQTEAGTQTGLARGFSDSAYAKSGFNHDTLIKSGVLTCLYYRQTLGRQHSTLAFQLNKTCGAGI